MEKKSWQTDEWTNGDTAMLITDVHRDELIDANPAAETMWGLARSELLNCSLTQLLIVDGSSTANEAPAFKFTSTNLSEDHKRLVRVSRAEGSQSADEVRRLTWALQAYARSAKALIRSHSLAEMAERVCQAIVAFDDYALATIALTEPESENSVRFIASAGHAKDYVHSLKLSVHPDVPHGQGPAGRAIRSGKPRVMRDAEQDPLFATWRELARQYGLRSNVTVPFHVGEEVAGAILVYAETPDAFSTTEVQIFEELGEELAFAIAVIRNKERLEEAREAQAKAENELLEQQAEMARIARALTLGEFASSIAHEITQPLAAVITNIETALRFMSLDGGKPDKVKAALERALRDADRSNQVVQHTRSLVTRADGPPEACHLNDLIKTVVNFVSGDLTRAHVAVEFDLAPDLPSVLGRQVQLQQVLINLISNAKDAMQPITERPRMLTIRSAMADAGDVLVAVEDNGQGLSDEVRNRVFERFFTSKHGGMGLGLTLSRSLIEAHGGRLWCEPLTPFGTRFAFTLPLGDPMVAGNGD